MQMDAYYFLKLRFLFFFCALIYGNLCYSQISNPEEPGKTYYDSAFTKQFESFHYKEMFTILHDTVNKTQTLTKRIILRHGPYVRFYPNGQQEISGYYKNNEKDSTWTYYDKKGIIVRTEKYKNDILTE